MKLPDDVDKRFAKIVKTNKPLYVKGMQRVIEALKENISQDKDLETINDDIKETLDAIGKINFGEGRYLTIVYQDTMRKIHTNCKSLLDDCESLTEILVDNDEQKGLKKANQILMDHVKSLELSEKISQDIESYENRVKKLHTRIEQQDALIQKLDHRYDTSKSKELNKEILELTKEKTIIEEKISSSMGKLKRGFRKFKKTSLFDAKLIDRLTNEPVKTVLETEMDEITSMFTRFQQALEKGDLKLKDNDKMIQKIKQAQTELKPEVKERHNDIKTKINNMKEEVIKDPLVDQIKDSKKEKKRLVDKMDGYKAENKVLKIRLSDKLSETEGNEEILIKTMNDFNISLSIE